MEEKIGSIAPFGLRMPSKIKRWVNEKAKDADRSKNYIILRILEKEIENEKSGTTA